MLFGVFPLPQVYWQPQAESIVSRIFAADATCVGRDAGSVRHQVSLPPADRGAPHVPSGSAANARLPGPLPRELLQVGGCSALGLSMPDAFAKAASAATGKPPARSVLLLWLWAGRATTRPGTPSPTLPPRFAAASARSARPRPARRSANCCRQLARRSDRYVLLRGMHHDQKDHNVGGTIGLTGNVAGAKASGGIPFPRQRAAEHGALVSYLQLDRIGSWPAFTAIGQICKVSGEQLRGQMAEGLGAGARSLPVGGFFIR